MQIINWNLEFGCGWKEFANYHSLKMGEFVVFKYIAKSYMKVDMFGIFGCVKNISTCHFEETKIVSSKRCPSNKMCSLNQSLGNKILIDLDSNQEINKDSIAKNQRKREPLFLGKKKFCSKIESLTSILNIWSW